MKIIWHVKEEYLSEEEKNIFISQVKDFHEESLIVFSEKLEIHIINDEGDYHKLNTDLKDYFEKIQPNKKGFRSIRKKIK
jgi:hypothetical protein